MASLRSAFLISESRHAAIGFSSSAMIQGNSRSKQLSLQLRTPKSSVTVNSFSVLRIEARYGTRIVKGTKKLTKNDDADDPKPRGTIRVQFPFGKKNKTEDETEAKPNKAAGTMRVQFPFGKKSKTEDEDEAEPRNTASGTVIRKSNQASGGGFFSAVLSIFGGGGKGAGKTVFVAGALGTTGSAVVSELLEAGFKVTAGVSSGVLPAGKGSEAVEAKFEVDLPADQLRRLTAVEYDPADGQALAEVIGRGGRVVVVLGKSEDGPRAAFSAKKAAAVVRAAAVAGASGVILVAPYESSGKKKPEKENGGFVSALLSFFGGVGGGGIGSVDEAVDAVVESGLTYTVVRFGSVTGSVETGSVRVAEEGSLKAGEVTPSQVADIVACILSNPTASADKVIDVASDAEADSSIVQQISALSVDSRRSALQEKLAEAAAQEEKKRVRAEAEEEARTLGERAREAERQAAELQAEAKQIASEEAKAATLLAKAQAKAQVAQSSLSSLQETLSQTSGGDLSSISSALRALPSLPSAPSTPSFSFFPLPSKTEKSDKKRDDDDATPSPASPSKKPSIPSFSLPSFSLPKPPSPTPSVDVKTSEGRKRAAPAPAVKKSPPVPRPAPKPAAPSAAPAAVAKSRRPLTLKERKAPPVAKAERPSAAPKVVEKRRILGFEQEVIYVDED